jgi:hypothetical protein
MILFFIKPYFQSHNNFLILKNDISNKKTCFVFSEYKKKVIF